MVAAFAVTILLVAAFGAVLTYRYFDNGTANANRAPKGVSSPSSDAPSFSTTTTLSTISISNSTGLGSIWTIENRSSMTFEFPTLDSRTGQIYALSATKNGTNRLLTAFDTTSSTYRTVQAVPGTGIGLAVDATTNEIYVAVAPPCASESAPEICDSNLGGLMRVNGSTGAIEGGIPISTIGFGVSIHGTGIGIDSRTGTLFALERCSVASLAPPCGRLLAYSPQTGALIGNLTLNADFEDFTIDSSTDTLYIAAAWEVQTAHVGTNTQGIIAVDTRNLTVKFQAPLNYAAIMDTSIDESTNTLYGIADKKVGNSSSVYLFSLSGNSGSLLLSVVVGDDCWLYGGMTLNTSTNQVYLYAHARNPLDESIVILDVATGRVVGMLPSGGIQDAILDPAHNRAFIIFTGVVPSDIGVATIPSAVIQGNVNPGILNATCPPRLPPGGVRP